MTAAESPAAGASLAPPSPTHRVVLLGASNLVRNIDLVFAQARSVWGGPLDFLAALGHGRSFGADSSVLGRVLPGILSCQLWTDLAERPPLPTAALVTDIGNDLLYGFSVEQIVGWLRSCLQRLAPFCRRLTLTELPLDSVGRVGRVRYTALRTLFFPGSRLALAEALTRAAALNLEVGRLAQEFGAELVALEPHWYGLDPIHFRRRAAPTAWRTICGAWREDRRAELIRPHWRQWLALARLCPAERRIWCWRQAAAQPVAIWPTGDRVSLY